MKIKLYLGHALEVFLQSLDSTSFVGHKIDLIDYDQYFLEMKQNGILKNNALSIARLGIVTVNFCVWGRYVHQSVQRYVGSWSQCKM